MYPYPKCTYVHLCMYVHIYVSIHTYIHMYVLYVATVKSSRTAKTANIYNYTYVAILSEGIFLTQTFKKRSFFT